MAVGWFKGGEKDDDTAVPREFRRALDEVLQSVDVEKSLAREVRDFVLTGAQAPSLTPAAGARNQLPYALGVFHGPFGSASADAWRTFYSAFNDVDVAVALRWAQLLELQSGTHYLMSMQPVAGARWAEALLIQIFSAFSIAHAAGAPGQPVPLHHLMLERMLTAAGAAPGDLLAEGFRLPPGNGWHGGRARAALRVLAGYDDAVRRHADLLRPVVTTPKAEARMVALEMLEATSPETLRIFAAELSELATSTSSQVRAGAGPLIARCGDLAVRPLRRLAEEGKPATRLEALRLLWSTQDSAVREWAREQAAADRAASVRALVDEWASRQTSDEATSLEVPPAPEVDWSVPVTRELLGLLETMGTRINAAIDGTNTSIAAHARQWEAANGGRKATWFKELERLPAHWAKALVSALEAGRPPRLRATDRPGSAPAHLVSDVIERPEVFSALGPVGITIVLNHLGLLLGHRGGLSHVAATSYNALHEATGKPTLLEISTMLDAMGVDGGKAVFVNYCLEYGEVLAQGWPDEAVAPFVAGHLDVVTAQLATASGDYSYNVDAAAPYRALATLPALPADVANLLFALALGTRKTARRPAQDLLQKVPRFEERVVAALSDGKGETRTVAAQWLGRLGHTPAVPALETAVAKERQDVAKGAMLDALEALGQPVERYLDRGALAKQAASALAKGLPKDLDWMAWDALPSVRWADSGDDVPLEVLQWFVAQAVKAKSPEPNAVLRKYCAMFDPRDREALGQLLLEAWIAEDLRPIGTEEARRLAEERARSMHYTMTHWPQSYENDPMFGASVEQLTAAYLPGFLRQPTGSATASKGVLAVAATCAGERAAPVAARYLKEWYGMRAAQGKALIAMLAWVEHPSATQLMLSVGSRFRTKSFQDEATRQAEALADRKGWSLGELADRTIPTAGFDETGTLELSYGERVFTGTLQPDLTIALHSPEGKKIASLPAPRQSDDQARTKDSKKALTAAKKELKAVVTLQTERLYEALCTERTWHFDDWQRYLNAHPVMRLLTQRLAWVAVTPAGAQVFRPLDDGTLTDVDDEEVTVPPDAVVAVAHDTNLDDADVKAWQQHFDDYEVVPLFQQFGKGLFELPESKANTREDTDFKGYLLEAFTLRGRAAKLGYTRGSTEDGGWFYSYEKRFPTLGLSAVIGFSGNPLPEQNRTVALSGLRFVKHAANGSAVALRLGDVPAVLLSEAYADIRLVAGEGTGYDPDWEQKVAF